MIWQETALPARRFLKVTSAKMFVRVDALDQECGLERQQGATFSPARSAWIDGQGPVP